VVLNNVKISAENGMTIGFASVTGTNFSVEAEKGDAVKKLTGAEVTMH
jgi:hypothetical protein